MSLHQPCRRARCAALRCLGEPLPARACRYLRAGLPILERGAADERARGCRYLRAGQPMCARVYRCLPMLERESTDDCRCSRARLPSLVRRTADVRASLPMPADVRASLPMPADARAQASRRPARVCRGSREGLPRLARRPAEARAQSCRRSRAGAADACRGSRAGLPTPLGDLVFIMLESLLVNNRKGWTETPD